MVKYVINLVYYAKKEENMRRFIRLVMLLCCVAAMATVVFAENHASGADIRADVSSDGTANVAVNVTVHLDEPTKNVTFPVPAGAKGVTMNGSSVRTYQSSFSSDVYLADMPQLSDVTGDFTVTFQYTVSGILRTTDKKLYVDLPIISGFSMPVQTLNFNIVLPSVLQSKPSFTSSYRQSGVESIMDVTAGSNVVTGRVVSPLQDREALTMTLEAGEDMFPGKLVLEREGNPEVVPMGICAALALIYWIVFLRSMPAFPQSTSYPPEGLNAGELGSRLTMAGVDLTMMVFSWAALGYVRICPDRYGRVKLLRRMSMGNERSDFENRVFKALFAKSDLVDATAMPFARLYRKTAVTVSGSREIMSRHSGSVKLMRVILCGINVFAGVCFAMNLKINSAFQVLLAIMLAVLGIVTAWGMQGGPYRIFLRGKQPLIISLGCAVIWMLPGIISGQTSIAVLSVLGQLAGGFLAAYGGRRSDLGRQQASRILGLRQFLKRAPKEELRRLVQQNPDYFHELMPYALALGVERQFAKQFDGILLPPCSYLTARENPRRTAREWAALMRTTADRMDVLQRRMEREKWTIVSVQRSR